MDHTLHSGPWAVGTTVTVYLRKTRVVPSGLAAPPGQNAITTAVVANDRSVTFSGLLFETAYWAIAQDAEGKSRWVAFTTVPAPDDAVIVMYSAAGPLTEAQVDAILQEGQILYETDAGGDVVAEWVKVAA